MNNVKLDMAVVPAIGVDGAMARIGHGKGFYDRFFDTLPVKPKLIVFLEVKDFYTKDVLSQAHDAVADFHITPSKNYIKRGINDRGFNRLRSRCGGRWSRVSLRQKDK
ncbi:5-formyltetrahydrofolate cyclo-ligase [Campylobacter concisus]